MSQPTRLRSFISRIGLFSKSRQPTTSHGHSVHERDRVQLVRRRLFAELLEDRRVLATYVVTTTADSGAGSLRQAIINANATMGVADAITFNIGSGQQSIAPLTELPAITDTLTIDATSQPGFAGTPLIELRGDSLPAAGTERGLAIQANNTRIRGLVINRFYVGIEVSGALGGVIAGNWIGVDTTGNAAAANRNHGLALQGSSGLTIGGTTVANRNVISGNQGEGIFVDGGTSSSNTIIGNFIGTNAAGNAAVGNGDMGVFINAGADNKIGGTTIGTGNVISGNASNGIYVVDAPGTKIQGNYVGLNALGTAAIPNLRGIQIAGSSASTLVGGDDAADGIVDGIVRARNIISGNDEIGLQTRPSTSLSTIQGNWIGLDSSGNVAIGNGLGVNGFFAVYLEGPAIVLGGSTVKAGNVISGNYRGVLVNGVSDTVVQGNYIGTNATGTAAVGNGYFGLTVQYSSGASILDNVISGNTVFTNTSPDFTQGMGNGSGLTLFMSKGVVVRNNRIGTNANGTAAVGNAKEGIVSIYSQAEITNNLISGNGSDGILAYHNFASESLYGVYDGESVIDHVGTIGRLNNGAGFATGVSGNGFSFDGIDDTLTDPPGFVGYRLSFDGSAGAVDLWVKTTDTDGAILTDGGGLDTGTGVALVVEGGLLKVKGSKGTAGQFNFVVTGPAINNGVFRHVAFTWTGDTTVNGVKLYLDGVLVAQGTALQAGATGTIPMSLGGGAGLPNLAGVVDEIAFYGEALSPTKIASIYALGGEEKTTGGYSISGNSIGINAAGNAAIPNARAGVAFEDVLGGTVGDPALNRNVISGNSVAGIEFRNRTISSNIVNNYIGINSTGTSAIANATGVLITSGASNNTVGGTSVKARNVISGNVGEGVQISGAGTISNIVLGNYIGIDAAGSGVIVNSTGIGVRNGTSGNTIGTTEFGQRIIATDLNPTSSFGLKIASNGDIYAAVGETTGGGIYKFDPSSGARTLVSAGSLTGAALRTPTDLAFESPTSLVVTSIGNGAITNGLVRVNTITGAQTLVSDFTNPAQGPILTYANGVVVEASGNYVVANGTTNGLYRIDRVTGNRTLISSGGLLANPYGLAIEANGQLITTNYAGNTILRVNPTTGAQSVVASGLEFLLFVAVAADGSIYATDGAVQSRVVRIDPTSGSVTVVAKDLTLDTYFNGIAIDPNGSIVIDDQSQVAGSVPVDYIRLTPNGARNVIGGNYVNGVLIDGANNNTLLQNDFGLNAFGVAAPNATGVRITNGATSNSLNDNTVRYSTSNNIFVDAAGNILRRNVSADATGLPIRLNPSTLSPGTITINQVVSGTNAVVLGEVRAKPSTQYTIDLFTSPTVGQASAFATSSTVTTDATGFVAFSITPSQGKLNGYVTATLTGLGTSGSMSTSALSPSVLATPAIILGLVSQSPEGTPITLNAFASSNPVTGYLWQVSKDGSPYTYELRNDGTQSEGGIQFTPDNQGTYTVSLRVTISDGSQFLLGPFVINVYNVAPTPSFEYGPSSPVALSPIALTSNNSDPGKIDVLKTSWVVRTGSATGPIVYSTSPATATTTSFTPAGGDLYYVTMTVDDGDGGVRTLTRVIEVAGLPVTADIVVPQPTAIEGQKVRARAAESLLNRTETLSFVWTLTKTPVGVGAVAAAYPFTIPSPGVIEFVPNDDGVYKIGLTVFKAGTTTGGIVAPTQTVTVTNASPRVSIVRNPIDSGSSQATLNAPLSLTANISDPGTADTHTILWSVKRDNQVLPVTGTGANFSYTPTVAGIYEIAAQATDDDFITTTPVGRSSGSRAFTVNSTAVNVAIVPPVGATTATTLNEGTGYTFTATVPTGVTAYAWKARTTEGVNVSQTTTASFTFTPPQGGRYQIELQVTLADGTVANAIYGPLTVAGIAPVISSLAVVSPTTTPIYEGTAITVRTTAVDARDPIGLSYRWELQKPGAATYSDVGAVDGSPIDLRFTPEDEGTYSVRVSVSDTQGLITTRVLAIAVVNAVPIARINATYVASSPTQLTFSAIASDPGTTDALQYEWSVNGGTFSAPVASNQFIAPLVGLNNVQVRVTDNDGGSITTSYFVIQGTSGNDTYTISASDVAASGTADQILYVALDGNDNITIASTVTKKVIVLGGAGNDTINASAATVNVLLDGGDGNDTLTGGIGDDVLVAGIGTNILVGGDGNNRFIGGGNDTMTGGRNADYYEVHFSTVVINDTTGGSDTVDLTAAQAGVTLNLSNNTGLPQAVFTGSTLALNGSFERLIGSTFNDSLSTSTPDTTIEGGTGNDTLTSSATNTTLDGGSGNDAIQLNRASGVFNGGGGNDTITGTLQSTTSTSIATGDGDDVVNVSGPSAINVAPVAISVGGGTNSVTASSVSGKIYANNGGSSASASAFGSATPGVSTLIVSSSTNVGIFGSASSTSTISVTNTTNVGIFATGQVNLNSVVGATLTSTGFGSASSVPTIAAVANSTNVGIFGSASSSGPSLTATVTNTTNVGIFGAASSSGSTIVVSGGYNVGIFAINSGSVSLSDINSGVNTIELSDFGSATSNSTVSLTVSSTTNVGIFGSATSSGSSLAATVTNSTNVGIFSGSGRTGTITVNGGSNIEIAGLNDGDITLSGVVGVSVKASSFGSATSTPSTIAVTSLGSTNVGIFGSASSSGPSLTATVTNTTNVGIFGSASSVSTITVTSSTIVGIFGSASSGGSSMIANVTNTTNVGIYASASPGDLIAVTGGSNIGVYNLVSAEVKLSAVTGAEVRLSDFGSATAVNVIVATSNSTNVGIFGSASSSGPSLVATVTNSTNVGIFGSASSVNTMVVSSSTDVSIYASFNDTITIAGSQRVYVQGGVFGSATSNTGINVTVSLGSTNVGIFATSLNDTINVGASSIVGLNLGGGDDRLTIDGATQLFAIGDAGDDRVTIQSGFDMLIYLGEGNDRAEVLGGSLIRILGETGDDQFSVSGGDNILFDGGNGNDQMFITGGQSLYLRGDAGNDEADVYGGVGISVSGAGGNDRFRLFGSQGGPLEAGLVYASLDGQDGDDTLEVRPLLSVVDRGPAPTATTAPYLSIPSWIQVPTWISAPTTTSYPASIELVGGTGPDSIYLEGADRLYAKGGDDNDTLTLQAGNYAELSGGYGLDNITINASGADNRVFGDQDYDTIRANAGVRLGVFGEEGADTIAFYGGVDSFARGGDAVDTMDIYAGTRVTLVGETDDDVLTIRAGSDGIAAGNSGNDQLMILGGDRGLLLGQSGDDTLKSLGGTQSIVSGGDGNDTISVTNRGDELYGDDGDDNYVVLPALATTLQQSQLLRLRELLYVDPKNFEPEARGSDRLDLSAFSTGATLNLGTLGIYTSLTQGLQSVIAGQLQVILLGSLENIAGTSGNDTLIGSSEPNHIQGLAGNDTISGLGGDDTLDGGIGNDILDGGTGDDSYVFSTVAGVTLGTDSIYEATNAGTDSLKFKGMPVGLGTLDLNLATPQSLAGGLATITLRQSSNSGLRGDFEEVVGTPFDDLLFGNELDNRIEPGAGSDIVDGRGGSDIYVYPGRNLGTDQINDASTGSGRDTLDFAAFDSPLTLDLALTTPQNLGEATLTLGAADSIENVIGTSFDDVILGNARDNALFGAAGVDRLEGRAGNDRLVANLPSIVLLDFDSAYRADRGDYNYAVAERNAIQQRIAAAYSAFDWVFTQSESQAQSLTADMGRNFVRLAFSQGRGGDVSGDAGEVDFRNIERRLVSEININPLLPTVRALLLQQKGPGYTAQDYSNMVVALTSTIAAHELAHTAGLRHADAFGPIGTGVYLGTDVSQIYPAYAGAFSAVETGKHIIASPASVGTTIVDATLPTYFGEREAIKLAFNEIGRSQRESSAIAGSHGSIATAESLGSLSPLSVPNLAPTTGYLRSGQSFKVSALAVVGDLNTFTSTSTTERDFYRFIGKAGEYVNVELLANGLRPLRGTAFDGELRIYKADGTLMATNDDDFEGTKDATLMDVLLPADGDYYISVGLSESPAIASTGGRYELFISRFAVGVSGSVLGDTLVGGAGSDTLIGGAADDLFLAVGALSGDIDVIDGRAGNDTVDKQGRVYNYTGTSIETVLSNGANSAPTVVVSGPVDGVAGQSALFTFTATDTDSIDANGPFEFTINWGDGTSSVVSSGAGQRSVSVNHNYTAPSATGTYSISASARDARQLAGPAGSRQFAATGYAVVPDPIRLGQTILVIVGTQGADTIVVRETCSDELSIRIRDRESSLRIRGRVDGDVNHILVFALDGNDQIVIDDDVDVDAEIWGGRGNDYIEGGEGNDIIWGGAGNDVLFGGEGRDILIGGTGADNIVGDAQDDILIGGLTAYDEEFNQTAPSAFGSAQRLAPSAQRLAMEAILAEWTSNRSYATRRNNILGVGTGTRLNGNNFLKVNDSNLLSNTVFDDGALDRMWGSCGTDWFFANVDGDHQSAIDRIMDSDSGETRTDIDKWF